MKYYLLTIISLFLISCGGTEEAGPPCLLEDGDYAITSTMKSTDCPEIFGEADNKPKNDGIIWSLEDLQYKCGETYTDDWQQHVVTGPCECFVSYHDVYHTITVDSFIVDRQVGLVCLPYYDTEDTGCNKECSAKGKVEGVKQ